MLGVEPGPPVEQVGEAAEQESRAGDEDERHGQLTGHENAPGPVCPPVDRGAARASEQLTQVLLAEPQRRKEPHHEAGRQRDQAGHEKDRSVHTHLVQTRNPGRGQGAKRLDAPHGQESAGTAPQRRQHQALDQEPGREPASAGPQRVSDRQVATATHRPGQDQSRHGRARQEEDEGDSGQESQQEGARGANQVGAHRVDVHAPAADGLGIGRGEPGLGPSQLGLGLLDTDARRQSGGGHEAPPVPILRGRRVPR